MAEVSKAERKAAKRAKKEKKEANGHAETNGVDKKRKHVAEVSSTASSAASSDVSDTESAVHANGHANGSAAKKAKLANGSAAPKLPAGVIDDGLSAIEKGDTAALGPPLSEFRIPEETQARLVAKGIKVLFPIQVSTFDHIYDGEDVMGRARTGTGEYSLVAKLTRKRCARSIC